MIRIDHPVLQGLLFRSVALLALGVLAHLPLAHAADKVKVCHRPPEDPSNFRIQRIAPSAVADHLAHGDTLVEPEVCDGVDNDCDGAVDEGTVCAAECPQECRIGVELWFETRSEAAADIEATTVECGYNAARGGSFIRVDDEFISSSSDGHLEFEIEGTESECSGSWDPVELFAEVITDEERAACSRLYASEVATVTGQPCNIEP